MERVLYDLHHADGVLQAAGMNYAHDTELALYYQAVLDKHGITQAEFDSSLVWYTDNPQIFDKIYPRIVARLEKDHTEFMRLHGNKQERVIEDFVPHAIDTLINPMMYETYPSVMDMFVLPESPPAYDIIGAYSPEYLDSRL